MSRLQEWRAAHHVPAPADAPPAQYVGLVTRVCAFAIDCAVINAVAIIVVAISTLIASVLHLDDTAKAITAAIGGAAYLLWSAGYFVTFWATTGQTPGNRVMRFRVVSATGGTLLPRRAVLRLVGLMIGVLALMTGVLAILFNDRRRGFHDWLARSAVVDHTPQPWTAASEVAHRSNGA